LWCIFGEYHYYYTQNLMSKHDVIRNKSLRVQKKLINKIAKEKKQQIDEKIRHQNEIIVDLNTQRDALPQKTKTVNTLMEHACNSNRELTHSGKVPKHVQGGVVKHIDQDVNDKLGPLFVRICAEKDSQTLAVMYRQFFDKCQETQRGARAKLRESKKEFDDRLQKGLCVGRLKSGKDRGDYCPCAAKRGGCCGTHKAQMVDLSE
jgi:hypothetical protein